MEGVSFESVTTVSREAFAEWVEERARQGDIHEFELLNGRIVMNPPAGYPHGSIEVALCVRLGTFVSERGLGRVFGPSQGFDLPSGDTVGPDVSYVSTERWRKGPAPVEGKFLRVIPDLVIEILSSATASRDRGEKKAIYERNGVREYWLVDPRARCVIRFVLRSDRFDPGTTFEESDTVVSEVLAGLELPVADVLRA